jgi:hypothetical protein
MLSCSVSLYWKTLCWTECHFQQSMTKLSIIFAGYFLCWKAKCHAVKCHYAKCRYGECHAAEKRLIFVRPLPSNCNYLYNGLFIGATTFNQTSLWPKDNFPNNSSNSQTLLGHVLRHGSSVTRKLNIILPNFWEKWPKRPKLYLRAQFKSPKHPH